MLEITSHRNGEILNARHGRESASELLITVRGLASVQSHVIDKNLEHAPSLSFHPNDSRGTVVISKAEFLRYLVAVGNSYEFIELY